MIRRLYLVFSCFFLAALIGGTVLLRYPLRGYGAHVVLSGSMEPTIRTGSLVLTCQVPSLAYRAGDVVAFPALPIEGSEEQVVHRIIRRISTNQAAEEVETKGDANTNGYPWPVPLSRISGRVCLTIPLIGYLFHYEQGPIGFLSIVCLTFFLIVAAELYQLQTGIRKLYFSLRSRFFS